MTNVLRIFLCTTFFYKNNKNNDTTSIIPPPHSAQMSIVQLFSQILILFHKWMKALKKSFGNDDLSLKVASSHLFLDIHYFTWMTFHGWKFWKSHNKEDDVGTNFLEANGPKFLGQPCFPWNLKPFVIKNHVSWKNTSLFLENDYPSFLDESHPWQKFPLKKTWTQDLPTTNGVDVLLVCHKTIPPIHYTIITSGLLFFLKI